MKRKILLTAAVSAFMMLCTGISASADVIDIPPIGFEIEVFPGEDFYLQHYDELEFLQEQEYVVTNSCKIYSQPDAEVISFANQDDIIIISAVYTSETGKKWGYTQFCEWIPMNNVEACSVQSTEASEETVYEETEIVTSTEPVSESVTTEVSVDTVLVTEISESDIAAETTSVSIESTAAASDTGPVTTKEQISEEAASEETSMEETSMEETTSEETTSEETAAEFIGQSEKNVTKPSFVLPAVLAVSITLVSAVLIIFMKKKK